MKKLPLAILIAFSGLYFSCSKTNNPSPTVPPQDTTTKPPVIPEPVTHLTQGLLAYYAFSGSAIDSTSNHLDGIMTSTGVSYTPDKAGHANSAVSFDGSQGFISVMDNAGILSPDSISISLLVYFTDVASRSTILNKVNFNDATGLSYGVGISSYSSDQKLYFAANPSTFGCSSSAYDVSNTTIDNGSSLLPNKWYHIVVSFADSVEKIYVNGALRTSVTRDYKTLNKCTREFKV